MERSRKRFNPEQIIGKLREAEVVLAQGLTATQVCRSLGIAEQTMYRWRCEYGGLKVEQAKRLKALEQENARLQRAVAGEDLEGNYNYIGTYQSRFFPLQHSIEPCS
jgi:putative transposase